MKIKYLILFFFIFFNGLNAFTQNQNNSIIVQGVTYYFRPSTTQSSPQPEQSVDFYVSGEWYSENAARAWVSLADWAVERCLGATRAIPDTRNETFYISAVYIYKKGDSDYDTLRESIYTNTACVYDKQIRIDYWVVRNGDQMSNGNRENRWFGF
ncbi:MAG: hypothetical protein FWB73_03560 [Treponema sp.]|nr:hypothetical protein [Treponema sp.]